MDTALNNFMVSVFTWRGCRYASGSPLFLLAFLLFDRFGGVLVTKSRRDVRALTVFPCRSPGGPSSPGDCWWPLPPPKEPAPPRAAPESPCSEELSTHCASSWVAPWLSREAALAPPSPWEAAFTRGSRLDRGAKFLGLVGTRQGISTILAWLRADFGVASTVVVVFVPWVGVKSSWESHLPLVGSIPQMLWTSLGKSHLNSPQYPMRKWIPGFQMCVRNLGVKIDPRGRGGFHLDWPPPCKGILLHSQDPLKWGIYPCYFLSSLVELTY